jgi:hypothetical protein
VKVLCFQCVVHTSHLGVSSDVGTVKGSAPQVPWCVLYGRLQQGVQEAMGWCQPIDLYALSCGSFRKKARNLIETAQRKSHRLKIKVNGCDPTNGYRKTQVLSKWHPTLIPLHYLSEHITAASIATTCLTTC